MLKGFWKTQKGVSFINKLKNFNFELKLAWQRAYRGYDDSEIWGLSDSITKKIILTLPELIENHHGHPAFMTNEEWTNILKDMLFHFQHSDEDWCMENIKGFMSVNNEYDDYVKEDKYRLEHRKKAYEMFLKYFDCLWD